MSKVCCNRRLLPTQTTADDGLGQKGTTRRASQYVSPAANAN